MIFVHELDESVMVDVKPCPAKNGVSAQRGVGRWTIRTRSY